MVQYLASLRYVLALVGVDVYHWIARTVENLLRLSPFAGVMRRWYRVQASCLARHPPVPRRSLLCVAHFAENEQRALFGKDSALNGIVRSLAYMYICLGKCVLFGLPKMLSHPSRWHHLTKIMACRPGVWRGADFEGEELRAFWERSCREWNRTGAPEHQQAARGHPVPARLRIPKGRAMDNGPGERQQDIPLCSRFGLPSSPS
jgi:hypothetical protein